jgi:hypothetical protein
VLLGIQVLPFGVLAVLDRVLVESFVQPRS